MPEQHILTTPTPLKITAMDEVTSPNSSTLSVLGSTGGPDVNMDDHGHDHDQDQVDDLSLESDNSPFSNGAGSTSTNTNSIAVGSAVSGGSGRSDRSLSPASGIAYSHRGSMSVRDSIDSIADPLFLMTSDRTLSMSSTASVTSHDGAGSVSSAASGAVGASGGAAAAPLVPLQQRKRRAKKSAAEKAAMQRSLRERDGTDGAGSAASDAGSTSANNSNTTTNAAGKVIKRRAARACVSCRNRKVRCDVVETFPCGNCRWDKIECVVQEGRRRRRDIFNTSDATAAPLAGADGFQHPHIASGSDAGAGNDTAGFDGLSEANSLPNGFANTANVTLAQIKSAGAKGPAFTFPAQTIQPAQSRTNPIILPKTTPSAGTGHTHNHVHGHSHSHSHDHGRGHQHGHANGRDRADHQARSTASPDPLSMSSTTMPLNLPGFPLLPINGLLGDPQQQVAALLPGFITSIPGKMAPEDIVYLHSKGAFTLPDTTLQRALLHAYVEFVHPYMPLLELHSLLETIHDRSGNSGTMSLLLYHAVMFAAASFVPARFLKAAGFSRRREARKSFFMKARALYDFDYETDRLTLVQALLLMTYWYETPDDQKDTWHWMGVAVSLAHTIGLHRDPRTTGEPLRRQRLRKLLWWCCFMRDRMIALGMRRPKRIRSEDADVPMLTPSDFDKSVLPDEIDVLPAECRYVRDIEMQEQLAELCVEKAKLCVLVGNMLQQQYTILPRGRARDGDTAENGSANGPSAATGSGRATSTSTMMLFPNRPVSDDGTGNGPSVVDKIDAKLRSWLLALPQSCRYAALTPMDVHGGRATIAVHRTLLHLVYHTTMSALHRPRIQPATAGSPSLPIDQQDFSRARVRDAADCVTRMGGELLRLRLEGYLPTAGVTVFLPAMFAHLLDIKGGVPRERRQQAVLGFLTCMRVMESLRETYAAAEIAKGFVESLLKKAGIDLAAVASFVEENHISSTNINGTLGNPYKTGGGGSTLGDALGTGDSTPVNGTSASLLQATANVGVPYTEDGIAHAVAMYAANTPRATTPPAEKAGASSADKDGIGSSGSGMAVDSDNSGSVPYVPVSMAAAVKLLEQRALSLAPGASRVTAAEQMWGLTPQGSAIPEDQLQWDAGSGLPGVSGVSGMGGLGDLSGLSGLSGLNGLNGFGGAAGTLADPKLDFDQWLDFPPEGMGSSTDHAFAGLFSSNFGNDMMNTDL